MTKQALLSFCHYYHGEDKCPFDSEKERPQGLFWLFEEMFVHQSLKKPSFFEGYKERVARYIENHPGISNDLTNDRFPIGTKAIIMYSEDMLQKWCPLELMPTTFRGLGLGGLDNQEVEVKTTLIA